MSPDMPPEADVIRLAREAMDMTAQDAAEASRARDGKGVSAAYWRDVERGYGGRRGQRVPTRASARALAAMARVTGVAPAQLARAGREDAARVLEEILRRDTATVADSLAVVAAPRPAQVPRQDVDFGAGIPPEELAPHVADIEQAAYRALVDLAGGELPGPDDPDVRETMLSLPGKAVFPENEHDQRTWDNPVYSPEERVISWPASGWLRARDGQRAAAAADGGRVNRSRSRIGRDSCPDFRWREGTTEHHRKTRA